jgi:cytosine/adenosine deaminase-related metal-dependent hydrolase
MEKSKAVVRANNIVLPGGEFIENKPYGVIINESGEIEAVDVWENIFKLVGDVTVIETDVLTPGFIDIHNHGLFFFINNQLNLSGVGGMEDVSEFWLNPAFTCEKCVSIQKYLYFFTFLFRLVSAGTTSTLASMFFPRSDPTNLSKRYLHIIQPDLITTELRKYCDQ